MLKMTDRQIAESVQDVLRHFGELVLHAQGTSENKRKTIGAVTIQFHDDGTYSYAFGGTFQKATTLGAIFDTMLTLREAMLTQETGEQLGAFIESLSLRPNDVN